MPISTDTLNIASASPDLLIDYTGSGQVANQNQWRLHGTASALTLGMRSDDNSQGLPALTFSRSGMTLTGMYSPVPLTVSGVVMDQDGVVNVGAAGADLTGATDSSAIVQKCLDLIASKGTGGGVLLFPAGSTVRFDAGVTFKSNSALTIRSPGSRKGATLIQGPNCQNLFTIDGSALPTAFNLEVAIENFYVLNYRAQGCSFYIKNPSAVRMSHITGNCTSGGWWGEFCHLENVATSLFEDFYVTNYGSANKSDIKGVFFNLVSTKGATDNRFRGCLGALFNIWLNANNGSTPGVEGIVCEGCTVLACNTGVTYASSSYAPPLFQYLNGHMDVFESFVILSNVAQVDFSHNDLYLDDRFEDANTPFHISGVFGFKFGDTFVVETSQPSGYPGRNTAMFYVDGNSTGGLIHDIKAGMPAMNCLVVLASGTSNCDVHHVSGTGGSGAIPYSDQGRANVIDAGTVRIITN